MAIVYSNTPCGLTVFTSCAARDTSRCRAKPDALMVPITVAGRFHNFILFHAISFHVVDCFMRAAPVRFIYLSLAGAAMFVVPCRGTADLPKVWHVGFDSLCKRHPVVSLPWVLFLFLPRGFLSNRTSHVVASPFRSVVPCIRPEFFHPFLSPAVSLQGLNLPEVSYGINTVYLYSNSITNSHCR